MRFEKYKCGGVKKIFSIEETDIPFESSKGNFNI